jgi:glycosidase
LVEIAHRFGIRVYFDNIMNHNAFDIPGFNADTPIDIYPGFVPEDFHLRVTEDGSFRKWDNTRNWGDAWQVQNLGLADLIDIANEPGTTNSNFGPTEGSTFPKIKLVRHPNNPEYYCYTPDGTYVGFGVNNGITKQMIAENSGYYSEYVEDMLHRSARWLMDRTKADGLRLDAVKHVRADFFGATFGDRIRIRRCTRIRATTATAGRFSGSSTSRAGFPIRIIATHCSTRKRRGTMR